MAKGVKTGGRKAGTPNRATAKIKGLISDFLENKFDKFLKELNKLEGKDYVTSYLKMIEYVVPKQRQKLEKIDFSKLSEEEANIVLQQLAEMVKDEQ